MGIENHVSLIGHIGRTPETAMTTGGTSVLQFSMATNYHFTEKATGEKKSIAEWHRIIFFGTKAETAANLLKKGSHLAVTGRLRTRKWTDKNGVDRYVTEIIADEFKLLDKKEVGNSADDLAQGTPEGYEPPPSDDIPL